METYILPAFPFLDFFKQNHRAKNSHPDRIWLLDLARTISPTAQLDGFDIDISGSPHKQWLPPNVTMRQLDALGEIPEYLVGIYDIVHLRLFQVVVKDNDPGPLLRNMLRMLSGCSNLVVYIHTVAFIYARFIALITHILSSCPSFEVSLVNSDIIRLHITSTNADIQYTEPGGFLQWAEYDMTSQTTIKADPSLSSSTLDAIPAFVQGFKKIEKHGRVGTQKYLLHFPYHFLYHIILQSSPSPNLRPPRRRDPQVLPDMLSPYNNSHQLIIPTK